MIVIWKMINSLSFFFLFLRDMSKPGEAHYYEWPSHEPPGVESAPRKSRWRSLSRRDWVILVPQAFAIFLRVELPSSAGFSGLV